MAIVAIHKEKAATALARDTEPQPGWWDPFPMWSDPFSELASLDAQSRFTPDFDVRETEDRLIVRADVPGVREQDLELTLTECQLVITGKRDPAADQGLGTSYSAERPSGRFSRTVLLPHTVQAEQALAELNDGVLQVVLPRITPSSPR